MSCSKVQSCITFHTIFFLFFMNFGFFFSSALTHLSITLVICSIKATMSSSVNDDIAVSSSIFMARKDGKSTQRTSKMRRNVDAVLWRMRMLFYHHFAVHVKFWLMQLTSWWQIRQFQSIFSYESLKIKKFSHRKCLDKTLTYEGWTKSGECLKKSASKWNEFWEEEEI